MSTATASSGRAEFWLGVGLDCRPACFDVVLCAALYGVDPSAAIALTSSDTVGSGDFVNAVLTEGQLSRGEASLADGYSVEVFPTVRKRSCAYTSFPGYLVYNNASSNCATRFVSPTEVMSRDTGVVSRDAAVIASARDITTPDSYDNDDSTTSTSSTLATAGLVTTEGVVQAITIWGHDDFPYPLFIQGKSLQLAAFENVNIGVSNIISAGDYSPSSSIDSAMYAAPGDWKEVWPSLKGKSTLYANFSGYPGSLLLMSSFLKYEDFGVIRNIVVQPATTPSSTNASSSNSSNSTGTDAASTNAGSSDGVSGASSGPPRSAQLDSDSAAVPYLCAVNGSSWSYVETIDQSERTRTLQTLSGCPNHFSTCQSNECGGPQKSRALKYPNSVTIPLYPGFSQAGPSDVTCSNDLVGVALNGVGIYGASDGATEVCREDSTGDYTTAAYGRTACKIPGRYDGIAYCGDAVRTFGTSIDKCGGYADNDYGIYKYYIAPVCLQQQLEPYKVKDHSPQLGWALDGFPIYGAVGAKVSSRLTLPAITISTLSVTK